MSQYMLLAYEEEVDAAEQAEREKVTPMLLELHASLREAGLLVGVQRLHSTESATSVRVRDAQTAITDGPFAVTKEVLAGYYILDCADLDEARSWRTPMIPMGKSPTTATCSRGGRWRQLTECQEGFVTQDCSNGPKPEATAVPRTVQNQGQGAAAAAVEATIG